VLQNQLKQKLPPSFAAQFPQGLEIAFATITIIKGLEELLCSEVRTAFALSMRTVWLVIIGISDAGLLATALLKEVPMLTIPEERFELKEKEQRDDVERAASEMTAAGGGEGTLVGE
jgi:hypothetical protein